MEDKSITEKIEEISKALEDKEFIESASNEELVAYMFLVEKLRMNLEKLVDLADSDQ